MKLKFKITAPINEAVALERITRFFEQSNYTSIPSSDTTLKFKRGLLRGMFFSFDPYNWECQAKLVLYSRSDVSDSLSLSIEYNVSNDPLEHSLTKEIWTDEFRRLQSYILTGKPTEFEKTGPKRKVTEFVFDIVGVFVAFLIILIATVLVTSYRLTGDGLPIYLVVINGLIIAGGAIFAGWRLWRKITHRRRKSPHL